MDDKNIPVETEVKYLIRMPDVEMLRGINGVRIKNIVQTYLNAPLGSTRRVRQINEKSATKYIYTEKLRISALSAFEDEREISKDEYDNLLLEKDVSKSPIVKTRYAFEYKSHIVEIDIYPFWEDVAILEIELNDEAEKYYIPEFIFVLKNVTDDKRYKNVNLASDHSFRHD